MSREASVRPAPRVAKELAASSGFLLARLGFAFKAKAVAALGQADCEVYDYSVLAIVSEGVPETQATIAAVLGIDPSRLVALLDSLERRGLVLRTRDAHDRRRHVVSITPAGKHELGRLRKVAQEVEDEYLAPLDPESRATLHELLLRLAAHHDPRCVFDPDNPSGFGP